MTGRPLTSSRSQRDSRACGGRPASEGGHRTWIIECGRPRSRVREAGAGRGHQREALRRARGRRRPRGTDSAAGWWRRSQHARVASSMYDDRAVGQGRSPSRWARRCRATTALPVLASSACGAESAGGEGRERAWRRQSDGRSARVRAAAIQQRRARAGSAVAAATPMRALLGQPRDVGWVGCHGGAPLEVGRQPSTSPPGRTGDGQVEPRLPGWRR